jgi:hypothetical protein
LLLNHGITLWYPQYAASATLLPLFVLIAVLRVSDFWSSFLLIVGLEAWLLRLNVVAAVLGTATWAVWMQPWNSGPLTLQQVGWLAVVLTVFAYAAVVAASWRARRA